MRKILLLLASLLLALPAAGQGDPESAYRAFHQSVVGPFNPQQWLSYLPTAKREKFSKDPQAELRWVNAVQFMKDEMPRSYRVTGKSGTGKSMRLTATGQGKDFFGKPEEQSGVIDLVEEGGTWKVSDVTWAKRKLP
jgi:RecA-family ATPase